MDKLSKIELKSVEKVACLAIRTSVPDELELFYQQVDDRDLFEFAKQNRVESIVGHGLIKFFGAEKTPEHWLSAHEKTNRIIAGYMAELDIIAELFYQNKIQLIVLKNGGIARGILNCRGCAPMGDLDLLIKKKDFQEAHQILISRGYLLEFRNPSLKSDLNTTENEGGAEYWRLLPNGEKLWLELQWRAVSGKWINRKQEPLTENLFADSIAIPRTKVRLLCPEDNLVQVCLHTAKHSYLRAPGFRLHLDAERIVHKYDINWELFLKKIFVLKIKTAVYFSLLIPKLLFDAPIPEYVLEKLKPKKIKIWLIFKAIKCAGLFNPDEKKFSKAGYIIFMFLLYDNWKDLWINVISKIYFMLAVVKK